MDDEIVKRGSTLYIDLFYPRLDGGTKAVQVGLTDVRAVDDIRIEYDFERNGWVIKQAQVFEWEADDDAMDPQWKEVAFIQAWGSERSRAEGQ